VTIQMEDAARLLGLRKRGNPPTRVLRAGDVKETEAEFWHRKYREELQHSAKLRQYIGQLLDEIEDLEGDDDEAY
jgi:hypothetical protein